MSVKVIGSWDSKGASGTYAHNTVIGLE